MLQSSGPVSRRSETNRRMGDEESEIGFGGGGGGGLGEELSWASVEKGRTETRASISRRFGNWWGR